MRVIDAVDFASFDGYDRASPTLRKSPIFGDCMGPAWDRWHTAWHDSSAKIYSGDIVRLHAKYDDGHVMCIIKELRYTRAGRWFGLCNDGAFEIGALFTPFKIEKVVALSVVNDWPPTLCSRAIRKADDATTFLYQSLARDAVNEWIHEGHVAGVPFPELDEVNQAARRRMMLTVTPSPELV